MKTRRNLIGQSWPEVKADCATSRPRYWKIVPSITPGTQKRFGNRIRTRRRFHIPVMRGTYGPCSRMQQATDELAAATGTWPDGYGPAGSGVSPAFLLFSSRPLKKMPRVNILLTRQADTGLTICCGKSRMYWQSAQIGIRIQNPEIGSGV
ncbi:hypothetical protein [Zhengella mangrovi]|uniref:hypothetical protein n=1 Tax=Zhengella mangrovi TaxID=1982044 RepID=UPI001054869D|nr:hypothetical protein [Zhengella mangrovi]